MRAVPLAYLLLMPLVAAAPDDARVEIARYADWTAATHREDGQLVCYAFTRAAPSGAVLSIAQRPNFRDSVAIDFGFPTRRNRPVTVTAETQHLDFYTAQHSAFARDGRAAVIAFSHAGLVTDQTTGPHDSPVADQFSLSGFMPSYAAISRACPDH